MLTRMNESSEATVPAGSSTAMGTALHCVLSDLKGFAIIKTFGVFEMEVLYGKQGQQSV